MTGATSNSRRSIDCEMIRMSSDGKYYYKEVKMTPQNHLYKLADNINELSLLLRSDDCGETIFETIKQIELQMVDIMASQQRQENLMNLIIKILGKDEN